MNEQIKWKLVISNQELFKNLKGSCGKKRKTIIIIIITIMLYKCCKLLGLFWKCLIKISLQHAASISTYQVGPPYLI